MNDKEGLGFHGCFGWSCRRQEEFEAELERCAVRRAPLGWDRAHRRYWWGLAGERACIYTEDGAGRIGLMTGPDQLQALMAVLDARGCREAGLLASCEKVRSQLCQCASRRCHVYGCVHCIDV